MFVLGKTDLGWRERATAAWFAKGFASILYGLMIFQHVAPQLHVRRIQFLRKLSGPMAPIVFRIPWLTEEAGRDDPAPTGEWLLTNGLGGYAGATLLGDLTRRYHGLLIAAFHRPSVRRMMLNHLEEQIQLPDGRSLHFGWGEQFAHEKTTACHGKEFGMTEFRLQWGLPIWRFEFEDALLEKDALLVYRQNTLLVRYRLCAAEGPVTLRLRPLVHFRNHHAAADDNTNAGPYAWTGEGARQEVHDAESGRSLRLMALSQNCSFCVQDAVRELDLSLERSRGNRPGGKLWSHGEFELSLAPGETAALVASAEAWSEVESLRPDEAFAAERERRAALVAAADPQAHSPGAAQLVLAADQFLVTPVMRHEDALIEKPADEKSPSIIAGYPWFTDWGRDAMVSLEGATLVTRRFGEGRSILLTFAAGAREGLVPNMFPEGEKEASYYTADASLWLFHALDRYVEATQDHSLVVELTPKLREIVEFYCRGTRFGIGVDTADGLVRQGTPENPLTWMDARVDDWIVTPRRGKAVEINALWYNALRLLEGWLQTAGDEVGAASLRDRAEYVRQSFNRRFWADEPGYLLDVVDGEEGDDASCRPNQIFAVSLKHPVLDRSRWNAVFETVSRRLLTPAGLRSLAPDSPEYHPVYFGDRRHRDAAYHQGTVWPWLLGAYVDVWMRVRPQERAVAHQFVLEALRWLGDACLGTLSEIHDADEPYTPRGCIAQAWSVAEVLRALVKTA